MNDLNKNSLQSLTKVSDQQKELAGKAFPERIIQFGEGNFLRAYLNWMLQQMNERGLFNGRAVAIQPTPHGKVVPKLEDQDSLYTTILQGIQDGKEIEEVEVNSSISRGLNPYEDWHGFLKLAESDEIEFVFSNTTEAGLAYKKEEFPDSRSPLSFPGKLAALLYRRYIHTHGDPEAGLVIIPCELVEDNGSLLKSLVLKAARDWNLSKDFEEWVQEHNTFCNTLVDRIVPGYPKATAEEWEERLGYRDVLMTVGEPFHLFVIESEKNLEGRLPFQESGLNVKWADVKPYRDLKVSVLNAPHTLMFSIGYLSGLSTVYEAIADPITGKFIRKAIYEEIIPVLETRQDEKESFAASVLERFQNHFVKHQLTDLGLNAIYKFKTRVLPLLNKHLAEKGHVPITMAFSLAALFHYYKPHSIHEGHFMGKHNGHEYKVRDDQEALEVFIEFWKQDRGVDEKIEGILQNKRLWGQDLTRLPELTSLVTNYFYEIQMHGVKAVTEKLVAARAKAN